MVTEALLKSGWAGQAPSDQVVLKLKDELKEHVVQVKKTVVNALLIELILSSGAEVYFSKSIHLICNV